MSEKIIQNALYRWCEDKSHSFIAPNIYMSWGESDLLSVTRNSYVFDHEIKISHSDFKADFKNKGWKHKIIFGNPKGNCKKCPNYFVYVVPEGLVKLEEIPIYAGLYYWRQSRYSKFGTFDVIKKPPRLHSQKPTVEVMGKLARSMMFRYWNYRLKIEEKV